MAECVIAKKLAEVMAEVSHVEKRGYNRAQNYNYPLAEDVFTKVNAALTKRGIALGSDAELVHFHLEDRGDKAARAHAVVKITLRFVDGETGEVVSISGLGSGCDSGDKAVMKANTAAMKYAYANAFAISFGDDPESDEKTDTEAKSKPAATEAAPVDGKKVSTSIKRAITKAGSVEALDSVRATILEHREALKAVGTYETIVESFKARSSSLKTKEENQYAEETGNA